MWPFSAKKAESNEEILNLIRVEFSTRVQALEQSILGEIRQLQISQELQQVRVEFAEKIRESERTLVREVQQSRTPSILPDVLERVQALELALSKEIRQARPSQELLQLPIKIHVLSKQVEDIALHVTQLVQLSPIAPTGEQKPIHELIRSRIEATFNAIKALEYEHAAWLDQQFRSLQETQQAFDAAQERLKLSAIHVFPSEEKEQDTGPVQQVQ